MHLIVSVGAKSGIFKMLLNWWCLELADTQATIEIIYVMPPQINVILDRKNYIIFDKIICSVYYWQCYITVWSRFGCSNADCLIAKIKRAPILDIYIHNMLIN